MPESIRKAGYARISTARPTTFGERAKKRAAVAVEATRLYARHAAVAVNKAPMTTNAMLSQRIFASERPKMALHPICSR